MALAGLLVAAMAAGCEQDMADQPRYEPLEASDFFANGMASRPLVEGTVARGHLRTDTAFFEGTADGEPVAEFPLSTVAEKLGVEGNESQQLEHVLTRGQQRFDIFCAPCHDRVGSGNGMAVQRGFPAPPSLELTRLREAPVGHFYDVITRGFGRMPSYASQVPPADRWAIVAYVRALQLSQHAAADDLPAEDRDKLPKGDAAP
ncbi:MAG: cytochrome c [Planctomycetota bacterium]|nr:MAG: cytochrome c [Planctomycetota bacterium]